MMNGFISKKTIFFWSASLLAGFSLGSQTHIKIPNIKIPDAFRVSKVDYSQISWIKNIRIENIPVKQIKFEQKASPTSPINFEPYVFTETKTRPTAGAATRPPRVSNIQKLKGWYDKLEYESRVFEDYQNVAEKIRFEFKVKALNPKAPAQQAQRIAPVYVNEFIPVTPEKWSSVPKPPKPLTRKVIRIEVAQKNVSTQAEPEVNVEENTTLDTQEEIISQTFSSALQWQAAQATAQTTALAAKGTRTQFHRPLNLPENSQKIEKLNSEENYGFGAASVQEPTPSPTPTLISVGCTILKDQKFVMPSNSNLVPVDSQLCPETKEWLSKNDLTDGSNGEKTTEKEGWVKVEGPSHSPTVMYYPAPNQEATLLLNQNALALMAMTHGTRVAQGTGAVIGVAPEGFKIEFTGRSEETFYFETSGKRYFAILNAEPAATDSVLEVISEKDQNLGATVFTPVLEGAITFMNIQAPKVQNIPIQILKSGKEDDPDVVGLEVSLSTQSGILGITQRGGRAVLRGVNVIPGLPVFLDVASKSRGERGYSYRYQLTSSLVQNGYFVLKQVEEKSLRRWLKQVRHGISDQSGMVVGHYDRKKLGGFQQHYFTRVDSKGARFGLDPVNYSILWNGIISNTDPLEGDMPRFMSVQVPEGLSQINLISEEKEIVRSDLIPISSQVIHMISE